MPTPREELELRRQLEGNLAPRQELEVRQRLDDTFGGVPIPNLRRGGGFTASGARETLSQFLSGFNERIGSMLFGLQTMTGDERQQLEAMAQEFESRTGQSLLVLPQVPDPVGETGRLLNEAIQKFTVGAEPETGLDRIARRTGQEIAATVPLAAGVFGAAARPAVQGGTAVQQGVQQLLQGIRNTPVRAALGETAAATGAGIGAGVAQEVAPGNALAEAAGQLAGGVAPAVLAQTPTALAVRGVRAVGSRLSPSALRSAERDEVARVLGPEMGQREAASLQQAQQVQEQVPGLTPSLAEATQSPALLATQKRVESQAMGRDLETLAARRMANVEAVERFVGSTAPDAPNTPAFVVDTANRRVQDIRLDLEGQATTTRAAQEDVAGGLPRIDRATTGGELRQRLRDIRTQTRERLNARAEDLGLNDVDLSVQFDGLQKSILDDFETRFLFDEVPPEVVSLVRSAPGRAKARAQSQAREEVRTLGLEGEEAAAFIKNAGDNAQITFGDIKSLRERVSDDLIDALGNTDAGARSRVRNLTLLKGRIDEFIDDGIEGLLPPDLAGNWRVFRQEYFQQYIEPFERGAAFKVRQLDGRGFFRVPDEQVANAFFKAGDVSGARQFKLAFGDDPEAASIMASAALDSLRDAAVRNGVVEPRLFDNWLRKHQSVLDEFPQIRQSVGDVGLANQALAVRQAQLDQRLKTVNDSLLGRRLQAVSRGTQTPEQLIQSAIRDPRQMQSLVASVRGDAGAMEALRRHVWDEAVGLPPDRQLAFMQNNAPSLAKVFDIKHLSDLQTIQRARAMIESVPAPQGRAFQPDPIGALNRQLGQGVPQIQSRVFAAESGRTSFRFVAGDMLARLIKGRSQLRSEALLKEALYDPKLASDLASTVRFPGAKTPVANRLNVWLFNLGIGGEEE